MDRVKKVISYRINNEINDSVLCEQIGIDRKTLYNVRTGKAVSSATIDKIDNFIQEKGL